MSSYEDLHHGRDRDATGPDGGPLVGGWIGDLHGRLTVRLAGTGRHTRATVTGEVDHACAGTLDLVLRDSLRRAPHSVQLDLSGVTFFDCGGLNALLRARALARHGGTALTLTAVSPAVVRLLALTGTRALFLPEDTARPGAPGRPPAGPGPAAGSGHHAA